MWVIVCRKSPSSLSLPDFGSGASGMTLNIVRLVQKSSLEVGTVSIVGLGHDWTFTMEKLL